MNKKKLSFFDNFHYNDGKPDSYFYTWKAEWIDDVFDSLRKKGRYVVDDYNNFMKGLPNKYTNSKQDIDRFLNNKFK